MNPEKLIIVFCCHINELIWKTALRESPNESYRQAAHWVWRKREYAGKLRKLFSKKNVFFQYIRCSPLASRRFKQPVYLLYQWRIYCNIFLDILHFLRIQEKRGNVNFVLKKTLVMFTENYQTVIFLKQWFVLKETVLNQILDPYANEYFN